MCYDVIAFGRHKFLRVLCLYSVHLAKFGRRSVSAACHIPWYHGKPSPFPIPVGMAKLCGRGGAQAQILQNLRNKQLEMQRQQQAARQAMLQQLRPEEIVTLQQMQPVHTALLVLHLALSRPASALCEASFVQQLCFSIVTTAGSSKCVTVEATHIHL